MKAKDLRNSILQLAIQGKLVPQNPNDEPAKDLLKKIKEEKQKLIADDTIKKEKELPEIRDDEKPFEIPESWEWVRLGEVGIYKKGPFGSSLTKSIFVEKSENTIKVYEQQNAIYKNEKLGNYYITNEYFNNKMKGFEVKSGDIIVSCAGTIGETFIMPKIIEKGIINQALMRIKLSANINMNYYLLYFDYIIKQSSIKSSKGTAIKNIPPFDLFKKILIPLSPLPEQQRIVEKIEELEPFIKQYEEYETKLTELDNNFQKEIKKSILQFAIQGKLVPQNPNDEPASELLKKIKAEKEKLIKDGTIKKEKELPEIKDEEKPFKIPESWEWVRLGEMINIIQGVSYNKDDIVNKADGNIRIIRGGNIKDGALLIYDDDIFIKEQYKNKLNNLSKFDIIVVSSTGSKEVIGKPAFCINETYNDIQIGAFLRIIRLYDTEYFNYIRLIFLSNYYKEYIKRLSVGTNINNIKNIYLLNLLIPLPPLPEQQRIVEKIEELMNIIDNKSPNMINADFEDKSINK